MEAVETTPLNRNPWSGGLSPKTTETTFDPNTGELKPWKPPEMGTNPYQDAIEKAQQQAAGDTAKAYQAQKDGQKTIGSLQEQYLRLMNRDQYPTFPNSAGLGSQSAFGVDPSANGSFPLSGNVPGFNPWSLQGEALARE